MSRYPSFFICLLLVLAVTACSPYRQQEPNFVRERIDIHERLSELMIRDGFAHEIRSSRNELEHQDTFLVKLTLDSLKARHPSLEKMLKDVGRICSSPGYAHLPIRIFVLSPDEDDRMFMFAILATVVRNSANISLTLVDSPGSELRISMIHGARGGS